MKSPKLLALPMHGEVKLRTEGLRTRDGHLIEWFARLLPDERICVASRPEPWPRLTLARRSGASLPEQVQCVSPQPVVIPKPSDRRHWWIASLKHRVPWIPGVPIIAWNPIDLAAGIEAGEASAAPTLVIDLLDDWSCHAGFASIHDRVEHAYATVFDRVDRVVANSEGTLALAHRFGRTDAELVANGVDPERFDLSHVPRRTLTVGYGGKIGFRLDLELVAATAAAVPEVTFEFVGPILDRHVGTALKRIPNVDIVGDVHYSEYPERLAQWDVAWAPHRLGTGEVGGDLIKLYEYRAAGLPTFSTRVIGWERALPGVRALHSEDFATELARFIRGRHGGEIPREPVELPRELTWQYKAEHLLGVAGVARCVTS
jgi:glycosyltransferase involved in cell wall biosynthesis